MVGKVLAVETRYMPKAQPKRCSWVIVDQGLTREYHDREWGVPTHDDRTHFEFLILEAAHAGLSWSIVLNKRDGYRRAFSQFDPEKIARYSDSRIDRLTADPRIIRNRMKITAAVKNARAVAAGRTPPTYTDSTLPAGMMIRAAHVSELRAAVIAIE
jgi:DNA-3-methyladenine glycosylase I